MGLGSHPGHVQKCGTNFSFITASAYLAVMGTWWMKFVFEWSKLPAYLCDVCPVFSHIYLVCVSYTAKGFGQLDMGKDTRL